MIQMSSVLHPLSTGAADEPALAGSVDILVQCIRRLISLPAPRVPATMVRTQATVCVQRLVVDGHGYPSKRATTAGSGAAARSCARTGSWLHIVRSW